MSLAQKLRDQEELFLQVEKKYKLLSSLPIDRRNRRKVRRNSMFDFTRAAKKAARTRSSKFDFARAAEQTARDEISNVGYAII